MKRKNDLFFIIIFVIVVGLSLTYLARASYSKYKKQVSGNVNAEIASWKIKINNETVQDSKELSNDITPTLDSDIYTKEGVLAPGGTGYFDIVINAEEVDVDFTYEMTAEVNENTPLTDLEITKYKIGETETNYSTNNKITGDIQKNTGDTSIRVYFKWNDDTSTETMNNEDDTKYATKSTNANTKIKVTFKFTQKQS